jgi:hypothetical protein
MYRSAFRTMRGRADVYFAFLEAALRQLRFGGVCAFICADRWMRNQYGTELRELVTSSYSVDAVIEMHAAGAFHDDVDAYPAITIIRRAEQRAAVVASARTEAEAAPAGAVSGALQSTELGRPESAVAGLKIARVEGWFKGGAPRPCNSPEQLVLLRRLEEGFSALEANARVGIGVETGNDAVFITKDELLVEPSRLLKLAVAKDLSSAMVKWSGNYLIDPWDESGLVNLENFPKLRAYIDRNAAELKQRHTAAKNPRSWYRTIDRVSHSLVAKPKLYIADIKSSLEPVLDRGETYPHHNLYFIQSDEWNLEVLGGLLLSEIGKFFVESYGVRMRGGYLRLQAQYLRRIRVPHPKDLSAEQSAELAAAFRSRDRGRATNVARRIYRVTAAELEVARGRRTIIAKGGPSVLGWA